MPADSVAPAGTPAIVTALRLSEPSVSVSAAVMVLGMAVSSSPRASSAVSSGASAIAITETSKGTSVLASPRTSSATSKISGSGSKLSARAVPRATSVKSSVPSGGGVSVRPASSAGSSVNVPSPLSMPADSVAPSGTSISVTSRLRRAAGSASAAVIAVGIAVSSSPAMSAAVTIGGVSAPRIVTTPSGTVSPTFSANVMRPSPTSSVRSSLAGLVPSMGPSKTTSPGPAPVWMIASSPSVSGPVTRKLLSSVVYVLLKVTAPV